MDIIREERKKFRGEVRGVKILRYQLKRYRDTIPDLKTSVEGGA